MFYQKKSYVHLDVTTMYTVLLLEQSVLIWH